MTPLLQFRSIEKLEARVVVLAADERCAQELMESLQGSDVLTVTPGNVHDRLDGRIDALVVDGATWANDADLRARVSERPAMGVVVVGAGRTPVSARPGLVVVHAREALGGKLPDEVVGAVRAARDARRKDTMVRWLERDAHTDSLTGLYNRSYFERELARECATERPTGVVLLDLAGTKAVNHNYGMEAGDQLLWRAGQVVARCIRATDMAARIAGDTFAVLLPDSPEDACRLVARRIAHEAERRNASTWAGEVPVTLLVGTACGTGETPANLLERARRQIDDQRQFVPALVARRGWDDGPSVA